MEKKKNPRYLYRYMKDSVYAIDLLLNHELCFSHPSDFNDPYDCKGYVGAMNEDKDILYNVLMGSYLYYILGYIERLYPNMKNLKEKYDSLSVNDKKKIEVEVEEIFTKTSVADNFVESMINKQTNQCYIVCLSREYKNPTMWAHYGDNHNGVCFEFDIKNDSDFFTGIKEVKYKKNREYHQTPIKLKTVKNVQLFLEIVEDIISTKYEDWQYEKEERIVRFIKENKNNKYFEKFNRKALNKIYFGYKVDDKVLNRYKKICECTNFNHVEFFKMGVSNGESMEMISHKCEIQPNRN